MKFGRRTFFIATGIACIALLAGADVPWRVISGKSKVALQGRSTIGSWTCRSDRLEAYSDSSSVAFEEMLQFIETDMEHRSPGETIPLLHQRESLGFSIVVPVQPFSCGNRIMERDLRTALRHEQYPNIVFRLERAYIAKKDLVTMNRAVVSVSGTIFAAGRTRPIRTSVKVEQGANGELRLEGILPMKMTDFGIDPPVGLFGLIRSRDEMSVSFDLTVKKP